MKVCTPETNQKNYRHLLFEYRSYILAARASCVQYIYLLTVKRDSTLLNESSSSTGRSNIPVAEFKEFERRFKFKSRFKYGWFHLKLYQMFQDLSRRLI